jgi:hypothetical protein
MEALYGVLIVGIGRSALATFYEATGRRAQARDLTSAVAEARADFAATRPVTTTSDQLELARSRLRDSSTVNGLRWEIALLALPYVPCSDLHQILFGPDSAYLAAYADARRTLVRSTLDSTLFAIGERALEHPLSLPANIERPTGYGFTRALARVADAALGGHRVEACASLAWWRRANESSP